MENKLIYGREELNEELTNKRNNFEESRNVLQKLLEEKVEISKKNEQLRKEIENNNKTYKNYKKREIKKLLTNLLQVIGIFGGVALLCNIPILVNTHTISLIATIAGGCGCSFLLAEYIYNITSYKKECNETNNIKLKYLEQNDNVCYEISKINKDLTDVNEKISKLDKSLERNTSKREEINNYVNFDEEISKPKQKCLKK